MYSRQKVESVQHRHSRETSTTNNAHGAIDREMENITKHLSSLESSREMMRAEYQSLVEQFHKKKASLDEQLHQLDDEIELAEKKRNRLEEKMTTSRADDHDFDMNQDFQSQLRYAENLTQYNGEKVRRPMVVEKCEFTGDIESEDECIPKRNSILSMRPDEIFTEFTQDNFDHSFTNEKKVIDHDTFDYCKPRAKLTTRRSLNTSLVTDNRPSSRGYNPLEIVTTGGNSKSHKSTKSYSTENKIGGVSAAQSLSSNTKKIGTTTTTSGTPSLDEYFKPNGQNNSNLSNVQSTSIFPQILAQRYATQGNFDSALPPQMPTENQDPLQNQQNHLMSSFIPSDNRRQQKRPFDRSLAHDRALGSDDYEWSHCMMECLRNTFGIQQFRDHQKEIINCTMSGFDAFVIMRTGGGKSLTYQLPALLEGQGPERKVTLVVSPLLSLIRDQEDQMNAFAPGSAVSITSGISGGTTEQARRWGLVRDPNAGVCIILVTPEKVVKNNKLKGELEKLHNQGRLGRFVIDECHCACQWGHDFRPDYTQLGILKNHFPDVPLMAVTATASDRVREDCCKILRLGSNYKLFRSGANRPNLTYIIKEKSEGKDAIISQMAEFIQSNHKNDPGIIYTLSKKEAEEVAQKLNDDYKLSARAFHSEISDSVKESVQRSWMKNKTQIVVATIAFGLGINKPDVRFVLHHTLSKSLEAYYQESGRAGRDGGPANCVLYYSPKDISRVLAMIHGNVSEPTFWSMVRYAQEHGNDAACRTIILSTLGEINMPDISSTENVEVKDVTIHSRIAVQLVNWSVKDLTIQQLVTLWRGKEAPAFVEEYPPKDLSKDDCERLIVNLLISNILSLNFVYTSYNTLVYIQLGRDAQKFLNNLNMHLSMRFPIRQNLTQAKKTKAKTDSKATSSSSSKNPWISTKNSKKSITSAFTTTTTKTKKRGTSSKKKVPSSDTIHILDSSSSSSEDLSIFERKRKARRVTDEWSKSDKVIFDDDDEDSL